jgi:hypothetical protein
MIIYAMTCMFYWDTWPKAKVAALAIGLCLISELLLESTIVYQLIRHWA